MNLSREFIALNVDFARHVERIAPMPLGEALLRFTHLYLGFGRSRSFDPGDPVWLAYLAGLRSDTDHVDWTYAFYRERQAVAPQTDVTPDVSFGCFSYAIWAGDRVRIHFVPDDAAGDSPLGRANVADRRAELAAMFRHMRPRVSSSATVVGGSWLYNVDAYRRLFPPVYLASARVGDAEYQFLTQWGQLLDRRGHVRAAVAQTFRDRLAGTLTMDSLARCFPYPVLRLEAPIAPFYELYGMGATPRS